MRDIEDLLADLGRAPVAAPPPVADVLARGDQRHHRRVRLVAAGTAVVVLGAGGVAYGLIRGSGDDHTLQPAVPTSTPAPTPSRPSAVTSTPTGAPVAPNPPALTTADRITLQGVGPLRPGMTYAQMSEALGRPLRVGTYDGTPVPLDDTSHECVSLTVDGPGADDLLFVGGSGELKAIGAGTDSARQTQSGIAISDPEATVRQVYPELLETPVPEYGLTYLSVQPSGSPVAVTMAIRDGAVESLWVGEARYTKLPEGCV